MTNRLRTVPGFPSERYDLDRDTPHVTSAVVDPDVDCECVRLAMSQGRTVVLGHYDADEAERLGQDLIDAAAEVRRRMRPQGAA